MSFSFSVSKTLAHLEKWRLPGERTETGFIIPAEEGGTELAVEQVSVTALDGMCIREVVRVFHPLPHLRSVITPDFALAWNKYAGMSTLLPAMGDAVPPLLFSKFPLLDDDEGAAESLYPLLAAASAYNMAGVAHFLEPGQPSASEFLAGASGPPLSFFGIQEAPAPVSEVAFREGHEWASGQGFFASHSASGISVEFPWDEGALTALAKAYGYGEGTSPDVPEEARKRERALGGETMLLVIDTTTRHPLFGPGLFGLLRLPIVLEEPQLHAVVESLNRWEASHADMVPTLGAWSADTKLSAPAFVCFFPGAFSFDFLPRHLTWWMGGRAWRARRLILNAGAAAAKKLSDR